MATFERFEHADVWPNVINVGLAFIILVARSKVPFRRQEVTKWSCCLACFLTNVKCDRIVVVVI